MWFENLTKDFEEFTSILLENTKSLAGAISQMAVEVSGQKTIVAGDEGSLLAQECPLDASDICALQQENAVYLDDPCMSDEYKLFEEWARSSAFSSTALHKSDDAKEALLTCRQRLLDESPMVLEKYTALVRTCGSPRQTEGAGGDGTAATSQSAASLDDSVRLTEDVFFDRYFFSLSQLRLRRAVERRRCEEEEKEKKKREKKDEEIKTVFAVPVEGLLKLKSQTERFAGCLMRVTDEFVGWGDEGQTASADETVEGNFHTEVEWQEKERNVNALESHVKKLEEELQIERRKLMAVFAEARKCGLSDQQMQHLRSAVAAAAAAKNTVAVVPSTTLPEQLSAPLSTPLAVTTKVATFFADDHSRGDDVLRKGSNESGASLSVTAVGAHQVAQEDELTSAPSRSSLEDTDSWAKV